MDKENTNVDEQQKMLTIMNELVELGKKRKMYWNSVKLRRCSQTREWSLMMTRPKNFRVFGK